MAARAALPYRFPRKAESYAKALRRVGVEPVLVSPDDSVTLAGVDGLLLTGGTDIDPARYGQTPHEATDLPDTPRDQMEEALIQEAYARDLPVLAICRGLQLLNVVRGGTLIQHLDNSTVHRVKGLAEVHAIEVAPGTKLASIADAGVRMVNSRHHQAVDRIGRGLLVSATAPDGVVEALEDPERRFVVAVQWHPEERIDVGEHDLRLFEAFAAALRK